MNKLYTITHENINNAVENAIKLNESFPGMNFSLFQLINILTICNDINQTILRSGKNQEITNDVVTGIVFYYIARGLLDKRDDNTLQKLCDLLYLDSPPEKKIPKNICPLMFDKKNGEKGIRSQVTQLFIKSAYAKENVIPNQDIPEQKNEETKPIAFIQKFNDIRNYSFWNSLIKFQLFLRECQDKENRHVLNFLLIA